MTANDTTRNPEGSTKMQQIERYGVIVLVFFLVTIVAVSFWGDSKSPGFWARLTGKGQPKKEQNDKLAAATLTDQKIVDPNAPLSPTGAAIPPVAVPLPMDGNFKPSEQVPYTPAPPTPAGNPFVPGANPSTLPTTNPLVNGPNPQPTVHVDAPIVPSNKYVVQKGDSLASIARHELGAESRWTEIQSLNGGVTPKNLRVGQTLTLPAGSATKSDTSAPAIAHKTAPAHASDAKKSDETKKAAPPVAKTTGKSSGYYTVKKGDVLRAIAREQLGDEARWKEIVAANPGLKADNIHVGEKLRMPDGKSHASDGNETLAAIRAPSAGNEPRVR
jgi:nucleoid-associated protein YgaU